jgi:hypothetical protein
MIRQEFHAEDPPGILKMPDGGMPSGRKSLPDMHYASGGDPTMERNLFGVPHGRHADCIS